MRTATKAPDKVASPNGTVPPAAKEEGSGLATISQNFVKRVEKQFAAELGSGIVWSDLQRALAQHLFIKIDQVLKSFEAKRLDKNDKDKAPYTWENVNMAKLSIDAVHRINIELDALIENHIHPVPYWNKRLGKYDLDLRRGYAGLDYSHRKFAQHPPLDIKYFLVHETDEFEPLFQDADNDFDTYKFKQVNPFNRGKVIGGVGYIMYSDPIKNRLVLVTPRDFAKAKAAAMTQDFWAEAKWEQEMQLKTVVIRTVKKLPLDPTKVNTNSFAYIEAQEVEFTESQMEDEARENANQEELPPPTPTQTPAALEAKTAGAIAFEQLDLDGCKARLGLNGDQSLHIRESLAAKSEEPVEEFLSKLIATGAADYQAVSAAIDALPEKGSEQPSLVTEPGY